MPITKPTTFSGKLDAQMLHVLARSGAFAQRTLRHHHRVRRVFNQMLLGCLRPVVSALPVPETRDLLSPVPFAILFDQQFTVNDAIRALASLDKPLLVRRMAEMIVTVLLIEHRFDDAREFVDFWLSTALSTPLGQPVPKNILADQPMSDEVFRAYGKWIAGMPERLRDYSCAWSILSASKTSVILQWSKQSGDEPLAAYFVPGEFKRYSDGLGGFHFPIRTVNLNLSFATKVGMPKKPYQLMLKQVSESSPDEN